MNSDLPISDQETSSDSTEVNQAKAEDSTVPENHVINTPSSEVLSDQSSSNQSEEGQVSLDNHSEPSIQASDTETRLQQLEKEHETLKSQYMRIAADFDNFRKRQTRDQDDLRIQLTCSTLSEILPVVDNFERARQQLTPEGEEAQTLHRSYQGLYKQLVDVLKQLGVAPMKVVGQKFDPTLHEAVLREPSEEQFEDVVTEELQRGYHLNGRVLRHALVKVSMGPGPNQEVENSSVNNSSNETQEIVSEEPTKEDN